MRYHDRREGFFLAVRNATDFAVFVLGSVAVLVIADSVGSDWPQVAKLIIPLTATLMTGIALVFQVGAKSALHASLKRRFIALERRLIRHRQNFLETLLDELTQDRLTIEADEPPVLRVLDTMCHNDVVWAMGLDRKKVVPITFCQRLFAQFFDVQRKRLYV